MASIRGEAIDKCGAAGQEQEGLTILGVRFHRLGRQAALARMSRLVGRGQAKKIYIANAHTLNLATTHPTFREVLNQADLLLNDGIGVQIASRLAGRPFPDNLVGTDLVPQLCHRVQPGGAGVFLLGGREGVASRAGRRLQELVPGLIIAGVHQGYFGADESPRIVRAINESGAAILLIGFGNPGQETWIHDNAPSLTCDLCVGVGGLFDHLGGGLRRAPVWMRKLGTEWVQILFQQPRKWRRYILGNPLFLARVLVEHFRRERWR